MKKIKIKIDCKDVKEQKRIVKTLKSFFRQIKKNKSTKK